MWNCLFSFGFVLIGCAAAPVFVNLGTVGLLVWFLFSISLLAGCLFSCGLVFLPTVFILWYSGAVAIVIVAAFFVLTGGAGMGKISRSTKRWIGEFSCGALLFPLMAFFFLASFWSNFLSHVGTAGSGRVKANISLYHVFYSVDVRCYSILVSGFEPVFLILGTVLLCVVASWSLLNRFT